MKPSMKAASRWQQVAAVPEGQSGRCLAYHPTLCERTTGLGSAVFAA